MNRVVHYFSVINKIQAKGRLVNGLNFSRCPTHIIPVPHEPQPQGALSPFQQYLINNKALERPFTGNLWFEMSTGFYHCVVCDTRLFTYNHKFQSHTGYPTFWRAIDGTIQTVDEEVTLDEVNEMRARHKTNNSTHKRCICAKCQTHLGAVFMDGPPPTFLRYTINSAMLKFYDMPDFPNPHILRRAKKSAARLRKVKYIR